MKIILNKLDKFYHKQLLTFRNKCDNYCYNSMLLDIPSDVVIEVDEETKKKMQEIHEKLMVDFKLFLSEHIIKQNETK